MDPRLLGLYNDELAYVRDMGAEFAESYPKIAGRLGMDGAEVADPYVERLLEGFAFLAARVQLKLQARFPDFTQHMLELVYPHFLAPTPSMAIVRFEPDQDAGRLEKGYAIPRGTKLLSQLPPDSVTHCEFRTAHAVHLWPIAITSVDYFMAPGQLSALRIPQASVAKAALRLRLRTTNGMPFSRLAIRSLQLHLTGAGAMGAAITEQLLADTVAFVARPVERPNPWQEVIAATAIRQRGQHLDEALLPDMAQSFHGYRLLREYFALPQRMHFVEVGGLADAVALSGTEELELVFVLRRANPLLERHLGPQNVVLFATPIVNLFERHADRIQVSDRVNEHHLVVDRVRPLDIELHSVLEVTGEVEGEDAPVPFRRFYSIVDQGRPRDQGAFYTLRREPRVLSARQRLNGSRTEYVGSEAFIATVDQDAASFGRDVRQLSVRCLCSNRDLPILMPLGKDDTDFTLEIGAPVVAIRCLTTPTRPHPSLATGDVAWRLISHLSLNYVSITDFEGEDGRGAEALRALLRLYAPAGEPAAARQVEGVQSVHSRPIVRRLPGGGQAAVARGIEVGLVLDETAFEGSGVFPLGAVLSHFFAHYVSINGFTETVLSTPQRGEVMRWPMTIGQRPIA